MRSMAFLACLAAVAAVALGLTGCNSGSTPPASPQDEAAAPPASQSDHHDGEHGDHAGHDAAEESGHGHGDHAGHEQGEGIDHDHPADGPHGGHLVELGGGEYHGELLHDEASHSVTVHVLDEAGAQPVAIQEPEITFQLFSDGRFTKYTLKAAGQGGDAGASEFTIVDEELCDALSHGQSVHGRLQITIDGKPYSGNLEHEAHEEHDGDEVHDAHEEHDHP